MFKAKDQGQSSLTFFKFLIVITDMIKIYVIIFLKKGTLSLFRCLRKTINKNSIRNVTSILEVHVFICEINIKES